MRNYWQFYVIQVSDLYSIFTTEMENDGRLVKMEVDYSSTCDEVIPAAKQLSKDSDQFHAGLEMLLQLEKQTRLVWFI